MLRKLILSSLATLPLITMATATGSAHAQSTAVDANAYITTATASTFAGAVATGGTVYVGAGASITPTAAITLNNPVTIICQSGTTIAAPASLSGNFITINADNVSIQGCNFSNTTGVANSALFVVKGNNFKLQNSTVTDTNSNADTVVIENKSNFALLNNTATGLIKLIGATQGLIQGNTITGNIYGVDGTAFVRVIGNNINLPYTTSTPQSSGVQFHANATTVNHITITGNQITSAGVYCVEVGTFGVGPSNPTTPTDIIVSNNTCDISYDAITSGGYSLDTVIAPVVTNNTFNAGTYTIKNNGIEIVNSKGTPTSYPPSADGVGAIVKGNTVLGGDIAVEKESNTMIEGNYVVMSNSQPNGIYIGNQYEGSNRNQVRNNTIVCATCSGTPPSGGQWIMIQVQNNPASGVSTTTLGTQITGNNLIGPGVSYPNVYGVYISDGGTTYTATDQTFISENTFWNLNYDVYVAAHTNKTYLFNNTCNGGTWVNPSNPTGSSITGETYTVGCTVIP